MAPTLNESFGMKLLKVLEALVEEENKLPFPNFIFL